MLKRFLSFVSWSVVAVFLLLFLSIILTILVLLKGGLDRDEMTELKIKSDHAVGVVDLSGEILSADFFRRQMKQMLASDRIKAIVVRIDSPGGAAGAAEEIYREIKAAREKKPVVCSLGSVAASGGLYAAVGCQKIFANRGTLTGSIGVIVVIPYLQNVLDRVGIEMNVVKSGEFKDMGSPFRKMDDKDRELMKALVDRTYRGFVSTVAESRKLDLTVVEQFADGRIILGDQAVELGLVDGLGGLRDAAKAALMELGDTAEPELVSPRKMTGLLTYIADFDETPLGYWLSSFGRFRLLYQAYI